MSGLRVAIVTNLYAPARGGCERTMNLAMAVNLAPAAPTNLRIVGVRYQEPVRSVKALRFLVRVPRSGGTATILNATDITDPFGPGPASP